MKQTKALIAGVLAGIAAPAVVGVPGDYPRLSGSDLNRMRGDVQRVGRDFSTVMRKNDGQKSSAAADKAA